MTKTCKKCQIDKPLEGFSKQKQGKKGRRSYCKICTSELSRAYQKANPEKVKDGYYKKVYGISLLEYKCMLDNQGGVCAICGNPETAKGKSMAVDHDADTGVIRGLLCHKCNAGLGHFNHNIDLLDSSITYLLHRRGDRR